MIQNVVCHVSQQRLLDKLNMFKRIIKIFQAILGVALIGYIVLAIMDREEREITRGNRTSAAGDP